MPMIQMNTRIDGELKRQGDAVFAERGYTPSQVVRAVWEYAARNHDLPPFMKTEDAGGQQAVAEAAMARARADEGAGLALKVAGEECGFEVASWAEVGAAAGAEMIPDAAVGSDFLLDMGDDDYDDMLREMEAACGSEADGGPKIAGDLGDSGSLEGGDL